MVPMNFSRGYAPLQMRPTVTNFPMQLRIAFFISKLVYKGLGTIKISISRNMVL